MNQILGVKFFLNGSGRPEPGNQKPSGNQTNKDDLLLLSAAKGDLSQITIALATGADINARDSNANTPLMLAAWNGQPQAVALLLERGADVFLENGLTKTALMFACQQAHNEIVDLLVRHGAHQDIDSCKRAISLAKDSYIIRMLSGNLHDYLMKSGVEAGAFAFTKLYLLASGKLRPDGNQLFREAMNRVIDKANISHKVFHELERRVELVDWDHKALIRGEDGKDIEEKVTPEARRRLLEAISEWRKQRYLNELENLKNDRLENITDEVNEAGRRATIEADEAIQRIREETQRAEMDRDEALRNVESDLRHAARMAEMEAETAMQRIKREAEQIEAEQHARMINLYGWPYR